MTVFDLSEGVDEDILAGIVPDVAALRACTQDHVFHAEGHAWRHTLDVCRALASDPAFRAADDVTRSVLSWAALLHDVEKPSTRIEEFDPVLGRVRVSHPSHSSKGARTAWTHMWRSGVPLDVRCRVHAAVLWHQRVFHVLSREDWREEIVRHSLVGRWSDLLVLARADNAGRVCPDKEATEERLALLAMAVEEEGCMDAAWPFGTEEGRLRFSRSGTSRFHDPPPSRGSRVRLMSGLPGVGKDTYVASTFPDLPVVSPDAVRAELGLPHGRGEGEVWTTAFERARIHLRAGRDFVWNATSLTRMSRDKVVDLVTRYGGTVEIHALDAAPSVVRTRNRSRATSIPDEAVDRAARRWDPVRSDEAHRVHHVAT